MKGPRVIAGSAGGLFLGVPRGFPSRPTQDRVKQAIFSSLGARVPGARVLDLYAGTGALGIEALSRGATSCLFVEKDPRTIPTLKANLQHCHLEATVHTRDALGYLTEAAAAGFDLIILDPPYTKGPLDLAQSPLLPQLARVLAPQGIVVWEHDSRNTCSASSPLCPFKTATYGETKVTYFQHALV
jgi:16S rRNA (guanine966-N2)-methyltransferase